MTEAGNNTHSALNFGLGILGTALGATAGYFAFGWLLTYGLYAVALPGALLGLGCGLLVRRRSNPLAVGCGVAALGFGIFTRWKHIWFTDDASFSYFLTHLHRLDPITLLMFAVGGLAGYWFALGSSRKRAGPTRETTKPASS